jgi:hypothetical protein
MPLRATRTLGTGDGWDITDSGHLRPRLGRPQRRTAGVDPREPRPAADRDRPVRRRGRVLVRIQAGRLARDRGQRERRRRRPHLPVQPRLAGHPDRVLHPRGPAALDPAPPQARALPRAARPRAAGARVGLELRADRGGALRGVLLRRRPRSPANGSSPSSASKATTSAASSAARRARGSPRPGRRQADDPRNELVFEFMRIVCEIHPRSFCMENVPGLVDMHTRDGIPVIDAIALMAQEGDTSAARSPRPPVRARRCEPCRPPPPDASPSLA